MMKNKRKTLAPMVQANLNRNLIIQSYDSNVIKVPTISDSDSPDLAQQGNNGSLLKSQKIEPILKKNTREPVYQRFIFVDNGPNLKIEKNNLKIDMKQRQKLLDYLPQM